MYKTWINREDNPKCILFFNGWGMDENAVRHMESSGYDICMFNDYKNFGQISIDFSGYDEVYVVAWSLGVWAASQVLGEYGINIVKRIAINGTVTPIDDKCGIPKNVFLGTLNGWDERNRNKFNMRMLGGRENFRKYSGLLPVREAEEQKDELGSIFNGVENKNISNIKWDLAVVGENDMIFTPQNQNRSWSGKAETVMKDMPHFPFILFNTWESIIEV
jgi:biotin synthesis protein BioG